METTQAAKPVQVTEHKETTLADELILTIDPFRIRATRYELIAAYISGMLRGSIVGELITNEALYSRCVSVRNNLEDNRIEYFVNSGMLNYLKKLADVKMGDDDA